MTQVLPTPEEIEKFPEGIDIPVAEDNLSKED